MELIHNSESSTRPEANSEFIRFVQASEMQVSLVISQRVQPKLSKANSKFRILHVQNSQTVFVFVFVFVQPRSPSKKVLFLPWHGASLRWDRLFLVLSNLSRIITIVKKYFHQSENFFSQAPNSSPEPSGLRGLRCEMRYHTCRTNFLQVSLRKPGISFAPRGYTRFS